MGRPTYDYTIPSWIDEDDFRKMVQNTTVQGNSLAYLTSLESFETMSSEDEIYRAEWTIPLHKSSELIYDYFSLPFGAADKKIRFEKDQHGNDVMVVTLFVVEPYTDSTVFALFFKVDEDPRETVALDEDGTYIVEDAYHMYSYEYGEDSFDSFVRVATDQEGMSQIEGDHHGILLVHID